LKRIANQAADDCERLVEAQFAAQTKSAKQTRRQVDSRFLAERVVRPELGLRASDDAERGDVTPVSDLLKDVFAPPPAHMRPEELRFLRTIDLLYGDYLDGSPFHRNDTKTANQLLGNLALGNLRHGGRRPGKDEQRRLRELDLAKRGGVFGGAYIWFNYINRMITQETAKLLLDYNAHAIPLDRLASADGKSRKRYHRWLAERTGRTGKAAGEAAAQADEDDEALTGPPPLETVEFTALDFLTENPERDREVGERFGAEVAAMLQLDRRNVVRKAFKSFPLHRLPKAKRTLNVHALYFRHLSGGKFLLLPFRAVAAAARLAVQGLRSAARVVKELLKPSVTPAVEEEPDGFRIAMRKVHRMRKPAFMRSLWLRAEFDIEYLGLVLPGAPFVGVGESLIDRDLDFIGASHAERMEAERLRERRAVEMRWLARWLAEAELDYVSLGDRLPREHPFLAHRRAEAVRALATAAASDRDDAFSLGAAIEGLQRALAAGADQSRTSDELPADLPPPLDQSRPRARRARRDWGRTFTWRRRLFSLPCFPRYDLHQQRRIRNYLRIHAAIVRPWVDLLLDQGGADPQRTLRRRFEETIQRTDVWSDQIVALRTIQTLTILDVHHYCRMVWDLGDYRDPNGDRLASALPFARSRASADSDIETEDLTLTATE
ncbi:MAG TPA: hypothetical protein VNC50_20840, partial [Planctomycetia bacterium]|nr:hypothetical protein [Planctomycetia bacterium]